MATTAEFLRDIFSKGLERVGLYYGSYRGFVVDNDDPEKIGRLRLQIPTTTGTDPMKRWAFPKGMYSGPEYGAQSIPRKGDLVWVEFEYGNAHTPIWMHGHPGKTEDQGDERKEERFKNITNHWYRTPKGHTVELFDEEELIRVTHSNEKNQFLIQGDKIVLDYKDGRKLIINDDGISLIRDGKKVSLGQEKESEEPATLGDTNSSLHLDTLKEINKSLKAINTFASTQQGSSTGDLSPLKSGYITLQNSINPIISQIDSLVSKEESSNTNTKSENVTLD